MNILNPTYQLSDGGAAINDITQRRFPIGTHKFTKDGTIRHLLMLGGSLLQLPAIRIAREEGWKIILADGNPNAMARPWVDYFEHVDLKDRDAMLVMARRYFEKGQLHGVFTAATDFSATVAWVAEHLNLPGNSHETALNASSKLRMRRIFREQGIPSPDFIEIPTNATPDRNAICTLNLPVVVKPIDNMGARGVRRLDNWNQLDEAIADARGHSRQGTIIIEEFIQGPEYSIDSLVTNGRLIPCGLALRHIQFPPYFVEVGHTLPSDLNSQQTAQLIDVFSRAVSALGIQNGAAKGDVFFTKQGPVIGEIAARLSGGYMSGWTFPLASGIEVTRAALYIAMGLPIPDLSPAWNHVSAERAIISIPGIVDSIIGTETLSAIPEVKHLFMRVKPGDHVTFPRNNVEKAGNIIAVHPNHQNATQAAEQAIAALLVRLTPQVKETDEFLFGINEKSMLAYPQAAAHVLPLMKWKPTSIPSTKVSFPLKIQEPNSILSLNLLSSQDWSWRTLSDTLAWLKNQMLTEYVPVSSSQTFSDVERCFWTALVIGGLQGAVYVADTLKRCN